MTEEVEVLTRIETQLKSILDVLGVKPALKEPRLRMYEDKGSDWQNMAATVRTYICAFRRANGVFPTDVDGVVARVQNSYPNVQTEHIVKAVESTIEYFKREWRDSPPTVPHSVNDVLANE